MLRLMQHGCKHKNTSGETCTICCRHAGTDVPAVIAPPGRTRATARMRQQGNSLSRPSSVHVDDFQRGVGAKPEPSGSRSSGSTRSAQQGNSGQRGAPHANSPGGPSLQKLLSDPAVVAVRRVPSTLPACHCCLRTGQKPLESLMAC